jgi:HEAT repeat protein
VLFPQLMCWLEHEVEEYRHIAVEALKLFRSKEAKTALVDALDKDLGTTTTALVAAALLKMGENRGEQYLRDLAHKAVGPLSASAATSIYAAKMNNEGLELMLYVLEHGDNEAKQAIVNQVCYNWLHSPRAFDEGGYKEAKAWLQSKLKSDDKTPTPIA